MPLETYHRVNITPDELRELEELLRYEVRVRKRFRRLLDELRRSKQVICEGPK